MQGAELWIAERGVPEKQRANRMHRREGADHADHRTKNAVRGACIAVLCVESVADETAITRLVRQVTGEVGDLALEAPNCGACQWYCKFYTII